MTQTPPTYKGRLQKKLLSAKEGDMLLETNEITKVTSLRATANRLGMKVTAVSFEPVGSGGIPQWAPVVVDGKPGWKIYLKSKEGKE